MKSMEQFLILVLVAAGIHALAPVDETSCDLRTKTCPCSPLLKGTVYIQVMADASGRELKCLKVLPQGNITVFNLKKETITTKDKKFNNRLQFIIKNGTIKITNLSRNDSGQYSVEVFNSNGEMETNIYFTLDVRDNDNFEGREPWIFEAHSFLYLIGVCILLTILLLAVSCCFVCREMKHRKKQGSGGTENIHLAPEFN